VAMTILLPWGGMRSAGVPQDPCRRDSVATGVEVVWQRRHTRGLGRRVEGPPETRTGGARVRGARV